MSRAGVAWSHHNEISPVIDCRARMNAKKTRATAPMPLSIAVLAAGDVFGEMSLMTGAARTATVSALTNLRVLEITKAPIEALLAIYRSSSTLTGGQFQVIVLSEF